MTPREKLDELAAKLDTLGPELEAARAEAKRAARAAKEAREHVAALEARYRHTSQRHLEAHRVVQEEERMSRMCEPVWLAAPDLSRGRLLVANVEGGQFVLVGRTNQTSRWWVRTGYEVGASGFGGPRLNGEATLAAWRAWCASQRGTQA